MTKRPLGGGLWYLHEQWLAARCRADASDTGRAWHSGIGPLASLILQSWDTARTRCR